MTHKNCDCGLPAIEQLDGEWLCQEHADEWLKGERQAFNDAFVASEASWDNTMYAELRRDYAGVIL